MYLSGRDIPGRDARGAPVVDDSFLAVLHAGDRPVSFVLPGPPWASRYELVVDTSTEEQARAPGVIHRAGGTVTVAGAGGAAATGGGLRLPGARAFGTKPRLRWRQPRMPRS